MSQVDFKRQPRGISRPRISRDEYKEIYRQQERAKRLQFKPDGEGRIVADTAIGRYVVENTYDGPQPYRARRNGTLIKGGMCKTQIDARLAIQEDISRRTRIDRLPEAVYVNDSESNLEPEQCDDVLDSSKL